MIDVSLHVAMFRRQAAQALCHPKDAAAVDEAATRVGQALPLGRSLEKPFDLLDDAVRWFLSAGTQSQPTMESAAVPRGASRTIPRMVTP